MNAMPTTLQSVAAARERHLGAWLRYALLQGILWLSVPVALYLVFAAPIPAVHDALHGVRHATTFFTCH